ncbi:alpha/beta hydrolase fold domain-containing protein [Methylobacterium durans]|uniref:Alpha/beta hydrolase n=1 Tax=Methylobacterium durans TaxID=2202825 RepID=A0A2U8W9E5_9HYPH|nr:alpha/beta hydrolase fold domain-containing protein [Methylobacterium durans]AWN42238.1 alpha/beta hydrolase [Methylobacterium durans]
MRLTAWHGLGAAGLAAAWLGFAGLAPARAAAPPPQPAQGPGGVGDRSATIVKRAVGRASAATFAFYAAGAAPAEGRPVVIFLHAWGAPNPQSYGAWIDHLARMGNLVLFPRFQEVNRTRPADATANAESLLKAALAELASDPDAKPDPKRVAVIGHLAGAPLALNLAAGAKEQDLPAPKLVFAVMPGGIASNPKARGIALKDLAAIPAGTMVITVIGDRDARAADAAARRILREASAVPPERKLFVRALSDDHGFPALTATLAAPAGVESGYDGGAIKLPPDPKDQKAPPFKWSADMALTGEQQTLVSQINNARTDALDYLAFWKTFDLAAAAAFSGADAGALKNNARFSDMERWTDGWPVKRLAVETPRAAPQPAPTPAASSTAPAARSSTAPARR